VRISAAVVPLAAVTALGLTACSNSDPGPSASATATSAPAEATPATDNTFAVEKSVFQVTYRLDGSISTSLAVGVDVPTGTKFETTRKSAALVKKEQLLGSLRAKSAAIDSARDGTVAESQRQLVAARLRPITAPLSGLARLTPSSARVESPGLDVVVPLKPLQELRYRGMNLTGEATVETVLGQRDSACVAVWIEQTASAIKSDSAEVDAAGSSAVHCRLAADLETAAGLPAVLTLTSQRQTDIIAVPLIYIGLDKTGENYVARVRQGGSSVERPIVVGSTDGVRRVVTEGLAAGDVIVPVTQP
jgi:hypothetical protein